MKIIVSCSPTQMLIRHIILGAVTGKGSDISPVWTKLIHEIILSVTKTHSSLYLYFFFNMM